MLGYGGRYFNSSHLYLLNSELLSDNLISDSHYFHLLVPLCFTSFIVSKVFLGMISDSYHISKYIFLISNFGIYFSLFYFYVFFL